MFCFLFFTCFLMKHILWNTSGAFQSKTQHFIPSCRSISFFSSFLHNGGQQECMFFFPTKLTDNHLFIPTSLINVFLNPNPCFFKCLLNLPLVSLKCPSLPGTYHFQYLLSAKLSPQQAALPWAQFPLNVYLTLAPFILKKLKLRISLL